MSEIYHALVLNLHQPPSNLDHLLDSGDRAANEILLAYDRIPRALWPYEDIARVHLAMSGTLLESLASPEFQRRTRGTIDCGSLLWALQNEKLFEMLGAPYYNPVLPLVPEADWDDHLERWRQLASHAFRKDHFAGFWPPEMGFCMELIPHLKAFGYRYVMVDSEYVDPVNPMPWQDLRYRPHIAEYDGHQIIVVVRDRDLSNAQQSGMDHGWFHHELIERTKFCDYPPLVTTATNGDTGGWFLNADLAGNFWQSFYREAMEAIRRGESRLRPTFITEYLDRFGVHGRVTIRRGAWNTDEHHGWNFHQWQGSRPQRSALARVHAVSKEFRQLLDQASVSRVTDEGISLHLDQARWRLLRAETSCFFYWGEAWLHRAHEDLDASERHMAEVRWLMP
ncbi:MAG: glycoside hydrolase family 57 [Rhodospirillales bacterium]|nr:glycoside hydrolase family 57 [Rhodospirillales bacterium]